MIVLRSLLFNVLYPAWSIGIAIVMAPLLLTPRRWVQKGARLWTIGLFFLMRWVINLRYEVRGRENIPPGGVIIAAKHQSAWETLIFHHLLDDPVFILKRELLFIPFVGWLMKRSGAVGIDRSKGTSALKKMIDQTRVRLAEQASIIIFPEGTRTPAGAALPLHPGVALLYDQLKAPVVPTALNSGVFWGRRTFIKKPGTVIIEFLPPMPEGMKKKDFLIELHARLNTASDRLMAEAGADVVALRAALQEKPST
ncbi:MAG: acyl-phosphate glycerol 3-phosphate acyltransferase [Alphaproteobacteria bacterium RIFOXYD12_FULL_60_8]|nr:MAG: acyl-phosphate glycerol 3-phosphate acyltransferase [Alphaproteobacteria bacterium RIFOXYD12_FULL_60_8]